MASHLKIKTSNQELFDNIRDLKKLSIKSGVGVYKAVAEKLSAPASQRSEINVERIEKYAQAGETIVVPGKVLSDGTLSKKVTVIAFNASENAIKKIEAAGGKFIRISEFLKKPDSKIKILG